MKKFFLLASVFFCIISCSKVTTFTIEATYSDYRDVKGKLYPFKTHQSFGPQSFDLEIKSVEINTKISPDTFNVE